MFLDYHSPSGKHFFTADLHLFHKNIIKYCNRPFLCDHDQEELDRRGGVWGAHPWRISDQSLRLMDATLIDNINATVGKDDLLWILGDFSFYRHHDKDYGARCKQYRDRIHCEHIHLVLGNHDEKLGLAQWFNRLHDIVYLEIQRCQIVLCHYAFAIWDKSHRKSVTLYGHSHAAAEPWLDQIMPGRRSIDVGVDNAAKVLGEYRPFSFEEIKNIMMQRPGFHFKH